MAITASELQVEVGADTGGAERGLARVERRMEGTKRKLNGIGKSFRRAGGRLTKTLTLPFVAAGGAAVKMASDFESSMTKIEGLVGVGEAAVGKLNDAVLDMAGEVGKSPQELANALFEITSAGLEGDTALATLRSSAKASAAGLGETRSVANAVTNAMNAYGHEVLSSKEATDILVATVREGKAEASELAPQFGQMMQSATELGIGLGELGGGLAFLTRSTGEASLAGTQMRNLLKSFMKPTTEAEKALGKVGMTFEGLQARVGKKGLLPALQDLRGAFDEAGVRMTDFFRDEEGRQAALALTGEQAGVAAQIFGETTDAAGALQQAWEAISETVRQKFNEAMGAAAGKLIKLGGKLMPAVTEILGTLTGWLEKAANWWENLSPNMQKAVLIFGAAVAAAGPLLLILGGLATLLAALISPVGAVIAGIGALAAGLVVAYNTSEQFRDVVSTVLEAVQALWRTFGDTIVAYLRETWTNIKQIISGALDVIGGVLNTFIGLFTGDWQRMWDGMKQVASGVSQIVNGIVDQIFAKLRAAASAMVTMGGDLIRGLIRGIKEQALRVAVAVKDAVGGAIDAGKDLLGIGSPSKVTEGIGRDMTEGLMRGLRADSERVHQQMLTTMQVPTVEGMAGGSVTYDNRRQREGDTVYVYTQDSQTVVRDIARENRNRAYLEGHGHLR